jgi:glycosyltransferase involved in cell wall biosynthesis/cold shock CspA family protein
MGIRQVTFLGQNSPDKFSGGRYHAWMMAEAAASLGYHVRFITDNRPFFYDEFDRFPAHREIELVRRPILRTGWSFPPGPCDILVVVPHTVYTPYYYYRARQLALESGARLIMVNFESANWFNALSPVKRPEMEWAGWRLLSEGASAILSIAEEGTRHAREFYDACPEQTLFRTCYPCINTLAADATGEVSAEDRVLLFTRFSKADHKGGRLAPQLLCEAMRGYTLVMVVGIGNPPDAFMAELRQQADRFGVRIELLHQIGDEEKFRQIKRCKLMLFPSYFEGFGLPPVEAQYCNVPCIAFDLPVLREVSGDGIICVPMGDAEAMREKIAEVLGREAGSGPALQAEIAGIARFESLAERVAATFDEAMEHGRAAEDGIEPLSREALAGELARLEEGDGGRGRDRREDNGHGEPERRPRTRTPASEPTGRIKWFSEEKYFGFIQPDEGERILFFDRESLLPAAAVPLKPGMPVTYAATQGPKGLVAQSVRILREDIELEKRLCEK